MASPPEPATTRIEKGGVPDENPFAPPAVGLPASMAGAWRKYGRIAGSLFAAILLGDLSSTLGFALLSIASFSARMVFVLFGTGCVLLATVYYVRGWSESAREWLAAGMVFGGIALASVPQLLLLDAALLGSK